MGRSSGAGEDTRGAPLTLSGGMRPSWQLAIFRGEAMGRAPGLAIALAVFGSAAAEDLHQETRDLLWRLDRALAPACDERTVVEDEGPRWVLDRCGTRVAWDVRIEGTTVSASLAAPPPPVRLAPSP